MATAGRIGYAGPACPRCATPLRIESVVSGLRSCLRCGRSFKAVWFEPAPSAAAPPPLAGLSSQPGAPCARHPGNQAEVSCQRCGQFMCSLCRIDLDQKAYCPACFERLRSEGELASTVTRFRNYSGLASAVILLGFLIWCANLPLGAYGLYLCIQGLRDKRRRGDREGIAGLWLRLVACVGLMLLGLMLILSLFMAGRRR